MAASSTVDTTEHKGGWEGERSGRSRCPHLLIAPSAATGERVGIKSTDERRRRDGRRPKSILGFCPAEFICLGHLTLSDFPLPPSLRRPPVCPSPVRLSADRAVSPGGRRAPRRRNIKSISERRYLSSRNYRGIYGPVSFVNCTRWAGPRRSAKKVSLASSCDGQAIFISLSGVSGDAVGRSLGLRFVDLRKAQEFISGSSLPLSSERSLARAQ